MAFGMLEPCAGKLARTVLRGLGAGNSSRLPDISTPFPVIEAHKIRGQYRKSVSKL
jgi:hypothetical protein